MTLQMELNPNLLRMEYAVRGPIPQRAGELQAEGRRIILCNIGNPQALGQEPLSYFREVLSLVQQPKLVHRERKLRALLESTSDPSGLLASNELIHDDILDRCEAILSGFAVNVGAYTDSAGVRFIREAVARYIDKRDRVGSDPVVPSEPDRIFLTDGASQAAQSVIEMLIAGPRDGIMIPIPQYPLYSATLRRCGGVQVDYYLNEEEGWILDPDALQETYAEATKRGVRVKAIVVINPGNPTGSVLNEDHVCAVIDFAEHNGLCILADEVYAENVYGAPFVSFARTLGKRSVPLFSMNSTSKGFYGECGHRGGYVEVRNPPEPTTGTQSFVDVLRKRASVVLCPNTTGQILTYLMATPPEEGSTLFERYSEERERILGALQEKAERIKRAFVDMSDVACFGKIGAMYLFPRLGRLPPDTTDFDYCMSLLETTGLCTVNGGGFGQKPGTHHLRIAFLPPLDLLEDVLPRWIAFHNEYVAGGR